MPRIVDLLQRAGDWIGKLLQRSSSWFWSQDGEACWRSNHSSVDALSEKVFDFLNDQAGQGSSR